jgi:predicted transcriptional regulator
MDPETAPKSIDPFLVSKIVQKYVMHHHLAATELPNLIATVHQALRQVGTTTEPEQPRNPAVPIRRSITRDALYCLECGRKGRTLRRHIGMSHDLTPDQYRARWSLQPDYPMTAPEYSERRSAAAKRIGLGQHGRKATGVPAAEPRPNERVTTEKSDAGLDPAFQASLSRRRRSRARKADQGTAE